MTTPKAKPSEAGLPPLPELPKGRIVGYEGGVMEVVYSPEQVIAFAKAYALAAIAGQGDAWLPIETVPEHCAVLIFTSNRGIKIERAEYARRLLEEARLNGEDCFYTHWMHLPDDPALRAKDDK